MKTLKVLKKFLEENGINGFDLSFIEEKTEKLDKVFLNERNNAEGCSVFDDAIQTDIVYKIIADLYDLCSEQIKVIANIVKEHLNIFFGEEERNIIKKILIYDDHESIDKLKKLYPNEFGAIYEIIKLNKVEFKNEARKVFLQNFKKADEKKKKDYLYSIFLKIYHLLELKNITLENLFKYNENFIRKELNKNSYEKLKEICLQDKNIYSLDTAAQVFYKHYLSILKEDLKRASIEKKLNKYLNVEFYDENLKGHKYVYDRFNDLKLFETEEYNFILFNISQEIYDRFGNNKDFYNYILDYIKESYRVLANNRVLAVRIQNVYDSKGHNLKWEIYSKICMYGEHFVEEFLSLDYYKPEEIASEMLKIYGITLDEANKKLLKKYYTGETDFDEIIDAIADGESMRRYKKLIDSFKQAYLGFTFDDCFILKFKDKFPNNDLPIVENNNEILLIFYKYRIDTRKIPCPECGGLKVSGNSFTVVGLKSWECKNEICSSRSKSNRGKRYSEKSVYMQLGLEDKSSLNVIPKELIKKWRRDIVEINNEDEIYEMLIKYYSFPNDKILFINSKVLEKEKEIGRQITYLLCNVSFGEHEDVYVSNISVEKDMSDLDTAYFNDSVLVSNFIIDKKVSYSNELDNFVKDKSVKAKIILGDAYSVLQKISENTITAIVTSPPYYNVREYSQWDNLYIYLYDMYNIIKQCYRVLKPGGIFLYNIGDIFDNERIVVKSTMGNKKIPLGAYSIYLFKKAGFELLDNIIWDKGEPQSSRHKNDGKFTPYYQKPLNAYEHMFIFKKPGADTIINPNYHKHAEIWKSNIASFKPVIKINSKGINLHGHSAPFPENIPNFVAKVFTINDDDIILDPFVGSGTSVISAYKNNRIGIGIEINEAYVNLCVKRAEREGIKLEVLKV